MLVKWKNTFALILSRFCFVDRWSVRLLRRLAEGQSRQPEKEQKEEKEGEEEGRGSDWNIADARNVLWREPTDIESRDLFNGPGGAEGAPDPKARSHL